MSEKKIIKKTLRYVFNTRELADIADKVSQLVREVEDRESIKKAVASQLKADLEQSVNDLRVQSGKHRDGYEYRDVDCEVEKNFRMGLVTTTRLDTGEIIEERAMTTEERQQALKLEPENEPVQEPDSRPETDDDTDDGDGDGDAPINIEM